MMDKTSICIDNALSAEEEWDGTRSDFILTERRARATTRLQSGVHRHLAWLNECFHWRLSDD